MSSGHTPANLREQVVDLARDGANLDLGVDEAGRNMPPICGMATWLSSTTTSQSSGK